MLVVIVDRIFNELLKKYGDKTQALADTLFKFYAIELDAELVPKARKRIYDWAVSKIERKLSELEIKSLDREIRQKKVDAKKAEALKDKLELQKQVKSLESKRNEKRRELFESQDQIEKEKDQLLEKIEANIEPKVEFEELFTIGWKVS